MIPALRDLLSGADAPSMAQNLVLSLTKEIMEPLQS
jgi:hypothetical protein